MGGKAERTPRKSRVVGVKKRQLGEIPNCKQDVVVKGGLVNSVVDNGLLHEEGGDDTSLLTQYLFEIGKFSLLSAEEEITAAKQIEAGKLAKEKLDAMRNTPYTDELKQKAAVLEQTTHIGDAAFQRLTNANLRLVVSVAKKFQGRGLSLLDLIQEGNIGLMRAVEKFDYRRGTRFVTPARWWIKQAIIRGLINQRDAIRLPVYMFEKLNKLEKLREKEEQILGHVCGDDEWAAAAGITVEELNEYRAIRDLVHVASLDNPLPGGNGTLIDIIDIPDTHSSDIARKYAEEPILERIDSLTVMERRILGLSLGLESGVKMPIEEIARRLMYSLEEATRLYTRAKEKVIVGIVGVERVGEMSRQDAVGYALRTDPENFSEQERNVLWLRFGLDGEEAHTLQEIGKKFGLTRERIRQIEAKALKKLGFSEK